MYSNRPNASSLGQLNRDSTVIKQDTRKVYLQHGNRDQSTVACYSSISFLNKFLGATSSRNNNISIFFSSLLFEYWSIQSKTST